MKTLASIVLIIFLTSWSVPMQQPFKIIGKVTLFDDDSPLPGVNVVEKGTRNGTVSGVDGGFEITVSSEKSGLLFSAIGFVTEEVSVGSRRVIDVKLKADVSSLSEIVVTGYSTRAHRKGIKMESQAPVASYMYEMEDSEQHNTEEYSTIHDHQFKEVTKNPLSTFSIDVDNASYSNMRRFINYGQKPPVDAVRIEEMINYFTYDYPQPTGKNPFTVNTEVSECPWNKDHKLVHIGLQGKDIPTEDLPPSNLVFLIDVSGSMNTPEKLPLVKSAFRLLVDQLRPQDHVAIVVYAGAAGLVLPSTSGENKRQILQAIDNLEAGGSTAGGAGLKLAYETAKKNFKAEGNNRVIIASDGDFNVGVSSNAEMERLIEQKKETGVFLTVLGFGMGNYKDSKMEILANKGNGNYAYIDNILEAKKVFVNEFGGTLFTIAKDVKLQVEFNPTKVKGYRLIGYENRILNSEDFNNDKKDAGDMGSGHSVTALYEIIPADLAESPYINKIDDLKYQSSKTKSTANKSPELMTVKIRYKQPQGTVSQLLEHPVVDKQVQFIKTTESFRFSAAVASFGMLLRDSEFKGDATYQDVLAWAKGAKGSDVEGYRAEFIKMVQSMQLYAER